MHLRTKLLFLLVFLLLVTKQLKSVSSAFPFCSEISSELAVLPENNKLSRVNQII